MQLKLVCVGDGAVGKTCMLISYCTDSFPTRYIPTIFDNYETEVMVDGQKTRLNVWDTAGQEDYDRLRPMGYINTDVFIVCYSVTSPASLDNVGSKWIPEIRHHCPNAPFLLVGTKTDLRRNSRELRRLRNKGIVCVDPMLAEEKGLELGAFGVMECSAKTQEGLKSVFDEAIRAALIARQSKKKRKNACALL